MHISTINYIKKPIHQKRKKKMGYYFSSFVFHFIASYFLLNSLNHSGAFQSGDGGSAGDVAPSSERRSSNHFHIIEVNSFIPASTCNHSSSTAGTIISSEEDILKLVHNHGPCSPRNKHGENNVKVKWESENQEYVVNVGLGTPKKELTLLVDTGSDLLWTQCKPCKLGTKFKGCFKQRHQIFDPSKSSTYSNISCPSNTCSLADTALGFAGCLSSTCVYQASYVQGSAVIGFLAKERLRIGSNTFNHIIFGCSVAKVNLTLPNIDGIIGLGQGFLSFVDQTSKTYNKVFSYCLPSKPSEIGFLKFGKATKVSKSLKFTKLGKDYAIDLIGIKLGNTTIPITGKKVVASIDSGTSFSALPSKSYIKLRGAYRKAMTQYHLLEPSSDDTFDTCYHIGGHKKLKLPKMSFLFGDGLVLDIPPNGVAFLFNSTVFCLPFQATPELGGEIVLLGNAQQKTLEVVYDVAGGKLGFGYNGCN